MTSLPPHPEPPPDDRWFDRLPGLQALTAWALPRSLSSGEVWRGQLAVRFAIVVALLAPLFLVVNTLLYRDWLVTTATLMTLIGTASLPVVLRWSGSLEVTGATYFLVSMGPLVVIAAFFVGPTSIALAWIGFVIAMSTTIGGRRVGFGGVLAFAAIIIGLYTLDRFGVLTGKAIPGELARFGASVNLVLLAGMCGLLACMAVTEQARAHRRVEAARAELGKAEREAAFRDRLASIGLLATGVAHEINNPLTYISANLDALEQDLEARSADDDLRLALGDAREGTARVAQIVEQLQAFAHRGEGRLAVPIDLHDPIGAAVRILRAPLRQVELVERLEPVDRVLGQPGQLAQVAMNLLENAAQAMPEGGRLEVATRQSDPGEVVFEVSDEGRGIPAELRERVFEPFFTTNPVGQGQGLGLAVAHGIVSDLGGRIELLDRAPRGTIVRVVLPSARGAAAVDPDSTPDRFNGWPLSILIVDDEPRLLTALERVLGEHRVRTAPGVASAIRCLEENDQVDLILCDLMMPDRPGWELASVVGRRWPTLSARLVFMTGGAFTPAAQQFVSSTDARVVEKPIGSEDLLALIQRFARDEAAVGRPRGRPRGRAAPRAPRS